MKTAKLISTTANVELFAHKSSDPKHNTQRNLAGRTPYAEDSSLKFFHARILSGEPIEEGLFFKMVESVALNYDNTCRGFRVIVFDLFGQPIFRPKFEECTNSKATALKFWEMSEKIDPVTYYRAEFKHRANRLTNQANAMMEVAAQLAEVTA